MLRTERIPGWNPFHAIKIASHASHGVFSTLHDHMSMTRHSDLPWPDCTLSHPLVTRVMIVHQQLMHLSRLDGQLQSYPQISSDCNQDRSKGQPTGDPVDSDGTP
jgi:hypothetical protein